MALQIETIRATADRVAASHHLAVVDLEFTGGAKHRTLRIFLEKDAATREKMAAEAADAAAAAGDTKVTDAEAGDAEAVDAEAVDAESGDAAAASTEAATAGDVSAEAEALVLPRGVPVEMLSFLTHEDCAAFSTDFGTVLDVEDLIPGAEYTLEVSSPGLERKLLTPADYRRFTGSLAKLQTFTAVASNRHFTGRLAGLDGSTLSLDLSAVKQKGRGKKAPTAHLVEIALANIEKANLVAEI